MDIKDKIIVVTGGGSGIGAALCRRFAREGARAVVVADLDGDAARALADEIGGHAAATDVARESDVQRLVSETTQSFGPIDLFCSNAGINPGLGMGEKEGGPFSPDEVWQSCWDVNLMAHVYASRAVLPDMLARGEGYLLNTASAAGLLTDFVAHAYAVSKHAAVAFAEWLAITYADRGIKVSCLCPMGVQTPLLGRVQETPGFDAHVAHSIIGPDEVADAVVKGLAEERFLILPHSEVEGYLRVKGEDHEKWLDGMRLFREKLYPDKI